jgi:uncharacterized protein
VVQMEEPLGSLVLFVALLVMLVGLAGIFLPLIPGTILIFLAALGYALLEGFSTVGWPTLLAMALLALVGTTADIWAAGVGAKAGGASGWSIVAGFAGSLLGFLLFSLPGAIIGAILGVLLVEIYRVGDLRQALKAGGGWAVGWALSAVARLTIGLVMVALFIWQVLQGP